MALGVETVITLGIGSSPGKIGYFTTLGLLAAATPSGDEPTFTDLGTVLSIAPGQVSQTDLSG